MDADLKRQRLIAEIANSLIRERSLDRHGDHMVDVAFKHFRDRLDEGVHAGGDQAHPHAA